MSIMSISNMAGFWMRHRPPELEADRPTKAGRPKDPQGTEYPKMTRERTLDGRLADPRPHPDDLAHEVTYFARLDAAEAWAAEIEWLALLDATNAADVGDDNDPDGMVARHYDRWAA